MPSTPIIAMIASAIAVIRRRSALRSERGSARLGMTRGAYQLGAARGQRALVNAPRRVASGSASTQSAAVAWAMSGPKRPMARPRSATSLLGSDVHNDAMAMAALLTDFATDANFRARVKDEFSTTKALFGDYVNALRKAYPLPEVK